MEDKNEMIAEFATKHNLTIAEATLVYGDGTEEEIPRNFALLQEIKESKSGNQGNQGQDPADAQTKRANELLDKAADALKSGNTGLSIRLKREAYNIQIR